MHFTYQGTPPHMDWMKFQEGVVALLFRFGVAVYILEDFIIKIYWGFFPPDYLTLPLSQFPLFSVRSIFWDFTSKFCFPLVFLLLSLIFVSINDMKWTNKSRNKRCKFYFHDVFAVSSPYNLQLLNSVPSGRKNTGN